MVKFIIFIVAAVAFWFYASYMFEDTFVDDTATQREVKETR